MFDVKCYDEGYYAFDYEMDSVYVGKVITDDQGSFEIVKVACLNEEGETASVEIKYV